MKSAAEVTSLITEVKKAGLPASEACWRVALACVGWAYVFGAYGEYCDPSNRRSRYSDAHPTIKSKCQNFNGKDNVPAGCVGCKWFLGTASSDESKHVGRTRFFDCRGFVYYVLHQVCGMWEKCPAGATTMWNTASNWKEKGVIADGIPNNVLVCLFVKSKEKANTMEHIGFAYNGETVECSSGVEHHTSINKKWTHWAVPVCVDWDHPADYRPTLKRGDKGEYVTLLQVELLNNGYDVGKSGVDGIFGAATEAAVKFFQKDNGLVSNGIVGQKTWDALQGSAPILYTVTIPHLAKHHAEALIQQYGNGSSMRLEE